MLKFSSASLENALCRFVTNLVPVSTDNIPQDFLSKIPKKGNQESRENKVKNALKAEFGDTIGERSFAIRLGTSEAKAPSPEERMQVCYQAAQILKDKQGAIADDELRKRIKEIDVKKLMISWSVQRVDTLSLEDLFFLFQCGYYRSTKPVSFSTNGRIDFEVGWMTPHRVKEAGNLWTDPEHPTIQPRDESDSSRVIGRRRKDNLNQFRDAVDKKEDGVLVANFEERSKPCRDAACSRNKEAFCRHWETNAHVNVKAFH